MGIDGNKRIKQQDIEDAKKLLGLDGSFPGSVVLKSVFLNEICNKLAIDEGVYSISSWLKNKEQKENINGCYITPITIKKFKNNWFDPLRKKAEEALIQNEYKEITLGGIEFAKEMIMTGDSSALAVTNNTVIENEQNRIIDGRQELWDILQFVKKNLKEDSPRNKLKWQKEWRLTVETYMKLIGDMADSPQVHMELLQHEINLYVQATIKTLQKLCPEVLEQFGEEFDNEYKKLSVMEGSILNKDGGGGYKDDSKYAEDGTPEGLNDEDF